MGQIRWEWGRLSKLSLAEQYELHEFRGSVSLLGQGISFLDSDGRDMGAYHLLGWEGQELVAYLRVHPGAKQLTIERITVAEGYEELQRELVKTALQKIATAYGDLPVEICADPSVEGECQSLGFVAVGSPFNMEGLPHINMVKNGSFG